MTSTPAVPRYIQLLLVFIALSACRTAEPRTVKAVDLMRDFNRAEKRPAVAFEIAEREVGGASRPAIVVPVPSRLTWSMPLPRHAVFQSAVALADPPSGVAPAPVRLRIGISDHRTFEGLSEVTLNPGSGWTDLRADLSAYAGWKWSLFYRPDRLTWRLTLAADAIVGRPAVALWGRPEIVTDTQSAREYSTRRLAGVRP
jgi:hypothetical protein